MAGRIPMATYKRCYEMLAEGADTGLIAIELDVSTSWVERETAKWKKGEMTVPKGTRVDRKKPNDGHGGSKIDTPQAIMREAGQFDFPKQHHELTADAARGLEDIEFFARRIFGIVLLPWQVMAAAKIVELLDTDEEEYCVINVAPGSGKAQPVNTPVLTPDGWEYIGDLRPGDEVIGSDGNPTKVVAVHPQGVVPTYGVVFDDGSATQCCADHLWQVKTKDWRGKSRVMTTQQLIEAGVERSDTGLRFSIPVVAPVEFTKRPEPMIPAWTMGALLGDGCLRNTSVTFSNGNADVVANLRRELAEVDMDVTTVDVHSFRITTAEATGKKGSWFWRELERMGLRGKLSVDKHIPTEYLYGSVGNRQALLRGLMDTDGTTTKQGTAEFATSSPRLADNVVHLIRSLGGTPRVRSKIPTYTYKGERRTGQRAYAITVSLGDWCPFLAEESKKARWKPRAKPPTRYIRSIERVDDRRSVCISVEAADQLYVTEDFIVTHNSVFFGRVVPEWLTARDRAMRGMVGSATNAVSTKLVDNMRRDFTRSQPDLISDTDRRRGLVQADSTLSLDYGRFRPDVSGALWTRSEFEVAQLDDRMVNQKEPTWSAFGVDTTFIGWRVDFALWDDLWDMRTIRTADARDRFFEWFDNTAETRLEPRGLFLLMGQRLAINDVYDHALAKRAESDDWEQTGDPEMFVPRYHHIVFKALDEDKLTGDKEMDRRLLSTDAPAWPEGPLLSPQRLPYKRLNSIRENNPTMFSLTYQQSSEGVTERLVDPLWVSGGQNPTTGEYHPGCRDDERRLWEVPQNLAGPLMSVAMTDPSGTNRWGHLWYLWQPQIPGETEDVRHVMALEHKRMPADQFLDWNSSTNSWSGLMEDWWQRSNELGQPIRWWIIEQNAAQRYLLQYDHVKRWMTARGVRIIGHNTHRNKHDPDLGLTATIPPVWRRGLIRIPYKDAKSEGAYRDMAALDFIKMHQDYPHVSADDLVMAAWFFEVNKDQIRPAQGDRRPQRRPAFAKVFSRGERPNFQRRVGA